MLEDCCSCPINGCDIPWDCLEIKWTNYDPGLHPGGETLTYVRKPTVQWILEIPGDPTDCIWIDYDPDGIYISSLLGVSWIFDNLTGDSWTHDGIEDDPYYVLGDYLHDVDFTGDYDVSVSLGPCVYPPL